VEGQSRSRINVKGRGQPQVIRKRNQLRKRQTEIMREGKTELFELMRIRARGTIRSRAGASPWNDRVN
jgi:hypothetical protein